MAVKSVGLLVLAGALFFFLAIGLVWLVIQLIRGNQNSILSTAPVTGQQQQVKIDSPGGIVLLLEVPRLASDFRNFRIDLTNQQTGQQTNMQYSFLTAQKSVYGVSTMKVPFGRLAIAGPALYSIQLAGLEPGKDYSAYRLIFSRPYIGRMTLQIIGIVICGVAMLGSLIWACWLAGLMRPPNQ